MNNDNICVCGKVCKNSVGVRIHQGRMGCLTKKPPTQRKEKSNKTAEEPDLESHHSVRSLSVEGADRTGNNCMKLPSEKVVGNPQEVPSPHKDQEETTMAAKIKVKWPKASENSMWEQLDEDLDKILDTSLVGAVDRKLKAMATIITAVAQERFGVVENKAKKPAVENRRACQIAKIRNELRALTKQYKTATENEKVALGEIREILKKKLKTLRNAENHRKKRKERTRKRAQFINNPFKFTSKMLGQKRSGNLKASKEEVETYLHETYGDAQREEDLGECPKLFDPGPPNECDFDEKEPQLQEVKDIIKKARAGSAPGPNGIPYKVYKQCPLLTRRLWRLLRVVWRRGLVADSWFEAEGCFIPKEENAETLGQFRTISLLNVEGKVFMSILSRRLTSFFLQNNYIDVSVQKGGIPGFSGCLEHTSVLSQLLREARENKGDLAVLWLDLANAYGSIPHKLVEVTLLKHHVPQKFTNLILDYYNHVKLRFTVNGFITRWQRLEVGIVTGCTISVILFAAAMYLVVRSAEKSSRGPVTTTKIKQPPVRAFMDDLTITTKSVIEARWTLQELECVIKWARMKFKPVKSRSLVIKKGKVEDRFKFKIGNNTIPTVTEKPVKSLGKVFDKTLNDRDAIKEMVKQLKEWMEKVDKSGLPGKFKAWCYQHGVLPRLLWPLLVYEVPATIAEVLEKVVSKYLRKWLGVPRSFSSINLYGKENKLQLPFKGVVEEYKATKARQVMMLKDCADAKVSQAGIKVRTGRKWSASTAVEEAESRLRHEDIVGTVTRGRLGVGCISRTSWKTASAVDRRKLVQGKVRQAVEEERQTKAVSLKQQGKWMKWDSCIQRKLTWSDLWSTESFRLKFLLCAVYDVLPSPTNLCVWGKVTEPFCKLCGKPANLEHVLSSCRIALTDGRYTWRHDQVLKALAHGLEKERGKKRRHKEDLQ